MMDLKPHVTLPDWAFKALAENAIDALIDRTDHEVIIVTRRERPDLVLLSHQQWTMLREGTKRDVHAGDPGEPNRGDKDSAS
jgi:hypothetical protein